MNLKDSLEREAKRLREQQDEFEQFRKIAEQLPADLKLASVTRHAYRGVLRLQLEDVATVEDVKPLLAQFQPVKLIRYKDSCLSFIPVESLRDKETARIEAGDAEETLIAPVVVAVEQVATYPTTFETRWWSRINGLLCQVEVKVTGHPLRIVATYQDTYERGRHRRVKTGYELQGIPSDWCAQVTRYASGSPDHANPFVIWWHWDTDNEQTRPQGYLPTPFNGGK